MTIESNNFLTFQEELKFELDAFLSKQQNKFPLEDTIKIDLHCHDYNSDVPDELLGRILNVPETWLPTNKLIDTLTRNNCDLITITNHNNARSCFELQKKGIDVLVAAEFSVTVPDYNMGIHVLTYGFDETQEKKLNKYRRNIYQFMEYAKENDIPTIWAHPLYNYSSDGSLNFDFFIKMSLMFERFEVVNGQRDTWQNMLVKTWIEGITPEFIDTEAERLKIDPSIYCNDIYKKTMAGGSDSHMGIFSGQTGTYLYIPDLKNKQNTTPLSQLALEAIKNGDMAVYGTHQNSEKLTVAFLDYVFQIAMYKKDPGLLRIMLHKGTTQDKFLALLISNAFSELKRHKVTMRFVELFHDCFMGKVPSRMQRIFIPRVYKPVFDEAYKIAKANTVPKEEMSDYYFQSIVLAISLILFCLTD